MSGFIPEQFITDLLTQMDIVELIDSYVPLKKSGNNFIACCPFHTEKTPSFNVVPAKQFYHCFGCGASGNVISFVMQYLHHDFVTAINFIAAQLGIQIPQKNDGAKNQQALNLYQILHKVCQLYQQLLKTSGQIASSYLERRGINEQMVQRYQLGYAPPQWRTLDKHFATQYNALISTGMLIAKREGGHYDRYRNRIMFPIHDRHGRIIGFGGRAIVANQEPKYLNSPETVIFQKSRELYGLFQILNQQHKSIDYILVVEGYLDVIALAQYGINNVVAVLGTSISASHIQLLKRHTKNLIFCFDGDTAGRNGAWRALENCLEFLGNDLSISFIFLPEGHDPDSLVRAEGSEKFITRLNQAQPLNRIFLETIIKDLDLHSTMGRSQVIERVKPYFLKMQEGSYKQLLLDEVGHITHLETHRLIQLISDKTKAYNFLNRQLKHSPINVAIALLSQHPTVLRPYIDQINLNLFEGTKQKILQQLLQQIMKEPSITTASLIEKWRDTPFFNALSKLAGWDHQVSEQALVKEFLDIILFLQKQNLENKINTYIAKLRKQGLTIAEKLKLQEMLKERHRYI